MHLLLYEANTYNNLGPRTKLINSIIEPLLVLPSLIHAKTLDIRVSNRLSYRDPQQTSCESPNKEIDPEKLIRLRSNNCPIKRSK